jgi:RHS repeat-associated protein
VSDERYLPYGATRSGGVGTDYQFTGQKLDSGTGLYYYGARYYDPVVGRFISADTVAATMKDARGAGGRALTVSFSEVKLLDAANKANRSGSGSNSARRTDGPSSFAAGAGGGSAGHEGPVTPQVLSRYSYTLNNPVKYVDASGHIVWIPAMLAIGTAIGGVGNLANYALNSHGDMTWEGAAQATAIGAGAGLAGTAAGLAAVTFAVGLGAGAALSAIVGGAASGAASNFATNVLVGEPDKFANMGSAVFVGGALGGLAGSLAPQRGFNVRLPGSFTKGLGSPWGGYVGPNTVAAYEAEAYYDAAGQFYGAMTESYDPPCGGE